MSKTLAEVVKSFPYAEDGIKSVLLAEGDVRLINDDLVEGLASAGYIKEPSKEALAGLKGPVTDEETDRTGDAFDDMTDAELVDYITKTAGKAPHKKAKRDKLLQLARALPAPAES